MYYPLNPQFLVNLHGKHIDTKRNEKRCYRNISNFPRKQLLMPWAFDSNWGKNASDNEEEVGEKAHVSRAHHSELTT